MCGAGFERSGHRAALSCGAFHSAFDRASVAGAREEAASGRGRERGRGRGRGRGGGAGPGPGPGGLLGDPAQHVAGRRRAAQAVSALSWDLPVNDRPPPLSVFEMEAFVRRFKHDPAVLPPALPPASSTGGKGMTEGGESDRRRSSEAAGRAASTGAVEVMQVDPTTDMAVGRFPS